MHDLIVIGGGPAGYNAAERAAHNGLKVLLIEKKFLGGVCLNEGCIPTKAYLNSAKIYDYALHGEPYGVTAQNVKLDHAKVIARKNQVVKTLVGGIRGALKRNGVAIYEGEAKITGKDGERFVVVFNSVQCTAKRLLLATGSVPITPPIPGVKEGLERGLILTNREILDITEAPTELTIIGGGVIGLEMACYFGAIGTKVTVIEMLDKIAGSTDVDISGILQKNLERRGVRFRLSSRVTAIGHDSVTFEKNGESQTIIADKVLLSIGRRPFTEGLGLECLGVHMRHGAVITDEHSRTNIPCVYAAGDVNGKSMLAHTAYRESEVAINHMLGKRDYMRYNAIPSIIYTNPEVASVGETEESAKEKGINARTVSVSMRYSGRYAAEVDGGDGICKLLVETKYNRLLGVHLIGSYASEIIYGAAMMIETEMRIDDIKEIVFPHPTVCEVIREALFEI